MVLLYNRVIAGEINKLAEYKRKIIWKYTMNTDHKM